MLGGKPRQQAIGHVIGIFAGAIACVPLFFLLFLPPDANGVRSVATMVSDNFAFPAALQWKGVAELIAKGVSALPYVGGRVDDRGGGRGGRDRGRAHASRKGRFPLSAVSIGLGVVLPPEATLRDVGGRDDLLDDGPRQREPGTPGHAFWVEGMEPICAGLISGRGADGHRQRDRQRADRLVAGPSPRAPRVARSRPRVPPPGTRTTPA